MSCCTTKAAPWPCGFSVWERAFHVSPVVLENRTGSAAWAQADVTMCAECGQEPEEAVL